jgi:two-component system response regulator AtoC
MLDAKPKILIVDDNDEYREALEQALSGEFAVASAGSIAQARDLLDQEISIALVDVRLREGQNDRDGLDLLESIRQMFPEMPVVMMTAYADIDLAVDALRLGATDFVQKARIDIREFRKVLHNALRHADLKRRNEDLEEQLRRMEPWELVGEDPKLQSVQEMVYVAARDSHCTVMIRGETGSGKELVARAIHSRGPRKDKPFVAVSIPYLPPELVPTGLFGHARGAFTDAKESRVGYVEKAQGGVLFLDEIGELNHDVQRALLRFLETRTFARVGSTEEITVDVQIVCATNENLERAIAQRRFREDLYYRLQSMVIWVPPLRERISDVPLLVDHFLSLFREQGRTKVAGISPAALAKLKNYAYPGNVRELSTILSRSMMLASVHGNFLIEPADLPQEVSATTTAKGQSTEIVFGENGVDLDEVLAMTELRYVEEALKISDGRKTDAWKLLALNDRFALWRRVKRIFELYPHLKESFPVVRDAYIKVRE